MTGIYSDLLSVLESEEKKRVFYKERLKDEEEEYKQLMTEQELYMESSRILATLSDNQLAELIANIETVINTVLGQIFSADDPRTIAIDKSLFRGTNPQLKVTLYTKDMQPRDIIDQTGTGLKQIVSVMFSLIVVSLRGDRPVILLDECLSGLHNKSKRIMRNILKMFANKGFQFVLIEYGIDDLGKIYNVEKYGDTSKVRDVKGIYDPNKKYLDDPDTSLMDENYVDEESE